MITADSIKKLSETNYIRKASHLSNYWFDFSKSKLDKYKNNSSDFNIIIYSELNRNEHFYIIPFSVLQNVFVEENFTNDKIGRKRWVGNIIDHELKISNCNHHVNVEKYYISIHEAVVSKTNNEKPTKKDIEEAINDDPDYYQTTARRIRKGQQRLRKNLLAIYENECCVSKTGPENVLQAAHIESHSIAGLNQTENALLLRSDIHDLFDDDLILIHPNTLQIKISPLLLKTEYYKYNNTFLKVRNDFKVPSCEKLNDKWNNAGWAGLIN